MQYQFKEGGNLRGSVFRTSTYDASLGDRNLSRMGLGISWRKSFNNLTEFFRGQKYAAQQLELEQQRLQQQDSIRRRPSGTW